MVIAIVLLVQLLILVLDYSAPQEPPAELSRKLVDEAAEAAAQGDGTAPKRCTDFCSGGGRAEAAAEKERTALAVQLEAALDAEAKQARKWQIPSTKEKGGWALFYWLVSLALTITVFVWPLVTWTTGGEWTNPCTPDGAGVCYVTYEGVACNHTFLPIIIPRPGRSSLKVELPSTANWQTWLATGFFLAVMLEMLAIHWLRLRIAAERPGALGGIDRLWDRAGIAVSKLYS